MPGVVATPYGQTTNIGSVTGRVVNAATSAYLEDGDLGEAVDLAARKPGLVADLQRELAAWVRDVGPRK